jgi:hypothetical protein
MSKNGCQDSKAIVLVVYGIIVPVGAAVAYPTKHASISMNIFMVLTGIAFFFLRRGIEKAKEGK